MINIDSVKMPPNNMVLIEYFDMNKTARYGDLEIMVKPGVDYANSDKTSSGKGRHLERTGKVIVSCDKLTHDKRYPWKTDIKVKEGDWVWFPSSAFDRAKDKFEEKGRKFVFMNYHKLYMRAKEDEYEMLNGYILAEKIKKKKEGTLVAPYEEFYGDIYRLIKRGDVVDFEGHFFDDPGIKEGDNIMTWGDKPKPLLEETGHKFFDNKDYHIFQTKEIVATVCF